MGDCKKAFEKRKTDEMVGTMYNHLLCLSIESNKSDLKSKFREKEEEM